MLPPRIRGQVINHGFVDESSSSSTVFEASCMAFQGFQSQNANAYHGNRHSQQPGAHRQKPKGHPPNQRHSQHMEYSQDSQYPSRHNRRAPAPPMRRRKKSQTQHQSTQGHRFLRYEDPSFYFEQSSASEFESESEYTDIEGVDITAASRRYEQRHRQQQKPHYRRKIPQLNSTLDTTTATESSMCLNIITVTLNLNITPVIGIIILGSASGLFDNGIYVDSIVRGGAVALDGRIECGDMILEVNNVSLQDYTNNEAVKILKAAVMQRGLLRITVAKSPVSRPKPVPVAPPPRVQQRDNYVRPIDLNAWVTHVNAMKEAHNMTMGPEDLKVPNNPNDVTSISRMSDYYDRSVVRKIPVKVPRTKNSTLSGALGKVLNPIKRFFKKKGKTN